jgi:hypothetical protein
VDDVAKGFINEYRAARIVKAGNNCFFMVNAVNWPIPIP